MPVEASVAAILRATCPDLPMPETITRPRAASISVDRLGEARAERRSARSAERRRLDPDHPPAGGDQPAGVDRVGGAAAHRSAVREDVDLVPAGEVEPRPVRQEVEAGLRELRPPLARQPRVERRLQPVQVEDVGGGIVDLRRR